MWRDIINDEAAHLHAAARIQFKREHSMLCLVALVQKQLLAAGTLASGWMACLDRQAGSTRSPSDKRASPPHSLLTLILVSYAFFYFKINFFICFQ
jgi:hypothetical protein